MPRSNLSKMSIAQLQSEISLRKRRLNTLHRRRARLTDQLHDVEARILEEGGAMAGLAGRKRPHNDQNLADALASLLSNRTLSVTEASEQVQSAGYRTTSPNFRTIVNQTLLKDPRFDRVSRGRYTAKGVGSKPKKRNTRRGR